MLVIEIAEVVDEDVPAVLTLWERCDLLRPWNDPRADIQRARGADHARLFIGRLEGKIVATVMAGFDGHRGWIYYLAVDPAHRKAGHGAAMMCAAEAWLRTRKAPKVQLMVSAENTAALGFHERGGYEKLPVVTLGKPLT